MSSRRGVVVLISSYSNSKTAAIAEYVSVDAVESNG